MKVQIISCSEGESTKNYTRSAFAKPRSLDEFDVNIIDLNSEKLWYCNQKPFSGVNVSNDLRSLGEMINNSESTRIIYVLPQDIQIHYMTGVTYDAHNHSYYKYEEARIKDFLSVVKTRVFSLFIRNIEDIELFYENTSTDLNMISYQAAFYFVSSYKSLSFSKGSNKSTTIEEDERTILTTLDILSDEQKTATFLRSIIFPDRKEEPPLWIKQIVFDDDEEQLDRIANQNQLIQQAEEEIEEAKQKLEKNDRYKSILYTNGDELAEVVVSILEDLFDCNLSSFVDEKHEDFLILKENYTVIGEIKGINTNVKNENISQLEHHYQRYQDKLQEEKRTENVKQILIINPLRKTPLYDREPIHTEQIELAKRNKSLIVETKTLLRIFECYKKNEISKEECQILFTQNAGLLQFQNIEITNKKEIN